MAVPGQLGDYIVKNYRRLLICVAPPSVIDSATADDNEPNAEPSLHVAEPDPDPPRRRRRSFVRSRRASRPPSTHAPPPAHDDAGSAVDDGPYVCVHEGQRMVRGMFFAEPVLRFDVHSTVIVPCVVANLLLPTSFHFYIAYFVLSVFLALCASQTHNTEDPFRGCVSSRSTPGPRRSGDFVIMGCMQV